jgi:hypothetical protein
MEHWVKNPARRINAPSTHTQKSAHPKSHKNHKSQINHPLVFYLTFLLFKKMQASLFIAALLLAIVQINAQRNVVVYNTYLNGDCSGTPLLSIKGIPNQCVGATSLSYKLTCGAVQIFGNGDCTGSPTQSLGGGCTSSQGASAKVSCVSGDWYAYSIAPGATCPASGLPTGAVPSVFVNGINSCSADALGVTSAKISTLSGGNGTLQLFTGAACGTSVADIPFTLGQCFVRGGSASVVAEAGTTGASVENAAGVLVAVIMTLSMMVSY